jgi:DNA primase
MRNDGLDSLYGDGSTKKVTIGETSIGLQCSGRLYKAVCPFHEERTPSLVVDLETMRYRCFGCGREGECSH